MKAEKASQHLVLPGEQSWQLWSLTSDRQSPVPTTVDDPRSVRSSPLAVGIPACNLTSIPLRLARAEKSLLPDLVRLQLERRGVLGGNFEAPFAWSEFTEDGETLLASSATLVPSPPESICAENATQFEPSPRLLPVPDGQITLWRELGNLVVALARSGKLVHFQALNATQLDAEAALEIQCLLLALQQEGIIPPAKGVTAWGTFDESELALLRTSFRLPVTHEERPAPRLPEAAWALFPPAVIDAQTASTRSRRTRRLVATASAVVLTMLAATVGHALWKYSQVRALRQELQTTADQVEMIRSTAQRWRALETAINPDLYPLERLLLAAQLLPPEGVRFILMEQRGANLFFTGEASSAPAAFKLFENLKNSPDWKGYQWVMPSPKLLANGSAQFQLEGKVTTGTPNANPEP